MGARKLPQNGGEFVGKSRVCAPDQRSGRSASGLSRRGRSLLPVSFELSQELLGVQRFRLPNLLSQPLQLDKLFE